MRLDPDYALFATVADAGSLSAAARALRISPSMVSKRLARLEDRLGTRLIHRTTRHLALTPAGTLFHRDVLAILDAVRAAEDRIAGHAHTPAGPLRVSAPTSFARLHIAPRLPEFLRRFPRVALEMELSDGYADLVANRFDLVVRITADVPAGLEAHRLARSPRVLAASPAYVAAHGAPGRIDLLGRHRLLAADGQLPWHLVAGGRRQVVDGGSVVKTNSSELVRELALGGVGIALRSLWDVGDDLRAGRLVRVLPDWEGQRDLGIYAMHARSPARPAAVDALVAFLRDTLSPAPWERTAEAAAAA